MHAHRKWQVSSLQVPQSLVERARQECNLTEDDPSWCLDDQSFEKMGAIMAENHGKLLGLYDELAMFLSQINVFRSKELSDSHEMAVFLQLHGASSWVRRTGMHATLHYYVVVNCRVWYAYV